MTNQRPPWAWLFFAQLSLVICASALAAAGHFPVALFQRSPFDKIGHLFAYGGLAFFGVAFFGRARRWRVVGSLLVAAALEELSQRAFKTRTFDLGDLAMNVAGIFAFGTIAESRSILTPASASGAAPNRSGAASPDLPAASASPAPSYGPSR